MTTVVTRAGKGSSLSYAEMDANFTNLNNAKLETGHPATDVLNVPSGTIVATNVQAAINELDTEKAPKTSPIFNGTLIVQVGGIDVQRFGSDTSGQLAGFRNKLINGDMRVNQRGVASSTSYGYFTCDRMYCVRDGGVAGMTQQQLYGVIPYKHTIRLQRDAGNTSTANLSVYQPIEQKNTQDLQGKQVTCSAKIVGSGGAAGTTVNFMLAYQTTAADYGVSGSWTVIGGTPQALPIGTSQVLSQTFTVPANATQIMPYLTFSCIGTASSDDSRYITDWQLELGSIATPFENRPYGYERFLCQRYFTICGQGWSGMEETATFFSMVVSYPTVMRVTPTLSLISTTINVRLPSLSIDRGITDCSVSSVTSTNKGAWLGITCSGGNVLGRFIQDSANGGDILYADAEL